jgi:hypothetical protein
MSSEKISNEEHSAAVKTSRRGNESQKTKDTSYREVTTETREPTPLDSNPQRSRAEEVQNYNCNTSDPVGKLVATHSAVFQQYLLNAEKNLPKSLDLQADHGKGLEQQKQERLPWTGQANELQNNNTILPSPNHALQYYQMQLMLREQQNKSRLLIARQQHDLLTGASTQEHEASAVQNSFDLDTASEALSISLNSNPSKRKATGDETSSACSRASTEGVKRRRNEEGYQFEHEFDSNQPAVENMGHSAEPQTLGAVGPSDITGRTEEGASGSPSPTSTIQLPGVPSNDGSNTQESIDHSISVEQLLKRVSELEDENSRLKKTQKDTGKPPRVQVFHVLDDEAKIICLEEPTWTFDSNDKLQLKAESRLTDYAQYLLRNPDIVCMIHKSYSTPQMSRNQIADAIITGTMLSPTPIYESMRLRSYPSHALLRKDNPEIVVRYK